MDSHIKEFYCQYSEQNPNGQFHKVISLNDGPDLDWPSVKKKVPSICKGWYELAHLSPKDRIDFNCEFWLSKLPYQPNLQEFVQRFFGSLDDICIYLTQKKYDDPFEAHLVYSLKDNSGFYSGSVPITEEEMMALQSEFPEFIFPTDYLAFLQIHNGFCKTTDCTGIIKSRKMRASYKEFQKQLVDTKEELKTTSGRIIMDPRSLVPFYESFGMPFYQCFWNDWYPVNEMGNVYFSGVNNTISDVLPGEKGGAEVLAFPTFTDWLMFYLEKVE